MRRIKAVVYGVGAMNSVATRLMLEKGVDIVGALARSPEKVGRDLGDVAGLGHQTGVLVEDDPERVLSTRQADIAVIAVASYMTRHVRAPAPLRRARRQRGDDLRGGAVSVEHVADADAPSSTTSRAATASRSPAPATRTSTGSTSSAWCMATSHRIETVTGRASWNVDDFGPEVAKDQRVDTTVEDFDTWLAETARPPSFGKNTLGALVDDLGVDGRRAVEHDAAGGRHAAGRVARRWI